VDGLALTGAGISVMVVLGFGQSFWGALC
ncbi:hypothetical protein LCGC14_1852710, partial [marine sediment metagenome]